MEQHINQRMAELAHSEIRAMTQACVQAKGLNMAQGVCDTPVPPVVLRAAAQAPPGPFIAPVWRCSVPVTRSSSSSPTTSITSARCWRLRRFR